MTRRPPIKGPLCPAGEPNTPRVFEIVAYSFHMCVQCPRQRSLLTSSGARARALELELSVDLAPGNDCGGSALIGGKPDRPTRTYASGNQKETENCREGNQRANISGVYHPLSREQRVRSLKRSGPESLSQELRKSTIPRICFLRQHIEEAGRKSHPTEIESGLLFRMILEAWASFFHAWHKFILAYLQQEYLCFLK